MGGGALSLPHPRRPERADRAGPADSVVQPEGHSRFHPRFARSLSQRGVMFQLNLRDDYSASLSAMPDRVRQALSSKANALAVALEAKIQQKLSGGVLNMRSGALARSIIATVDESSADVSVRIGASGDVKYAAIQEFGGTI